MLKPGFALFCLGLAAHSSPVPDFSNLYDRPALEKMQAKVQEDWEWNFRNQFIPLLTPEEKNTLGQVKVKVPLWGPQKGLSEFYAGGDAIYFPALSMKFYRDLATAYAWLEFHGYNLSTVNQYVGMINYRDKGSFPGSRIPRPLDALGIPSNALEDSAVNSQFRKIFISGATFLFFHELGHLRYHHPGYGNVSMDQARANEEAADRFALEISRRMGLIPAGAVFFFMMAAYQEPHRVDFPSEEEWNDYRRTRATHPLTAKRMQALAKSMESHAREFAIAEPDPDKAIAQVNYMADQIRQVGEILENEKMHVLFRQQSATTEPRMLRPRHDVVYSPSGVKTRDLRGGDEAPFEGRFDCVFTQEPSKAGIPMALVLSRSGDHVRGEYSYGVAVGRVEGTVTGGALNFDWVEGGTFGKGHLTWNGKDGRFEGTWGNGESPKDGGRWTGRRSAAKSGDEGKGKARLEKAGGTCESACSHYLSCKGTDSQENRMQCISACVSLHLQPADLETLEKMDCASSVAAMEKAFAALSGPDCRGCQWDGSSCIWISPDPSLYQPCDSRCCQESSGLPEEGDDD